MDPATSAFVDELVPSIGSLPFPDDSAWDVLDGDLAQWLLDSGERISDGAEGGKESSRSNPSREAGSTGDISQQNNSSGSGTKKRSRTADSDTAEEKLERLRNRNRVAQARRRQRQREELQQLESRVEEVQRKIAEGRSRSRDGRQTKSSLSDRVAQADSELLVMVNQRTPGSGFQLNGKQKYKHALCANSDPPCVSSSIVPTTARLRSCLPPNPDRKIEDFDGGCSPLFVEACVAALDNASPKPHFSFSDIFMSQKVGVATQLGSPVSDVCWFLQSLYPAPAGPRLSMSTTLSSLRCTITILVVFMLTQLELGFLDKELDCYNGFVLEDEGSSNAFPYISSDSAPARDDGCSLVQKPLVDTTKWGAGVTLTCGSNEECDVRTAVPNAVAALCREYKAHMPPQAWQRRCRDFQRKLDCMVARKGTTNMPIVDGGYQPKVTAGTACAAREERYEKEKGKQQAATDSVLGQVVKDAEGEAVRAAAQAASGGVQDDGECCLGAPKFEGTVRRVAVVVQLMADAVQSCLQEPVPLGQEWRPSEKRRQDVCARCEHVMSAWSFTWCAMLNDAPYTARSISVDICGPGLSTIEWMEETHAQLFKRMRLSIDQRQSMVALWREWQRRRRALDSEQSAACGRLTALCNVDDLPDSFIALVSARCRGCASLPAAAEVAMQEQPRELLGLSAAATAAASAAVEALMEVQDRDARLQVDFYATFVRPWFLTEQQRAKTFGSMVSHGVKLDLLMLWQIASSQARRFELFVRRTIE